MWAFEPIFEKSPTGGNLAPAPNDPQASDGSLAAEKEIEL
jgi:hypothetical protein